MAINIKVTGMVLLCSLLSLAPAASDVKIDGGPDWFGEVAQDYPGWIGGPDAERNRGYVEFAGGHINWGVVNYYRIFGEWPESWSQVVDEGLFQTELIGPGGNVIDPDDREFDCLGDKYYLTSNQYTDKVYIASLTYIDGWTVRYQSVLRPLSLNMQFRQQYENSGFIKDFDRSVVAGWLESADRMRMVGLVSMLGWAAHTYKTVYGDYPDSWAALLDSGLAPIDDSAVNPLTGGPIFGDGRPNDIYYEYIPAQVDSPAMYKLVPVDAEGRQPEVWVSI